MADGNSEDDLVKLGRALQLANKGVVGFLIRIMVVVALGYAWLTGTNATAKQALQNTVDLKIENQLQEIRGYMMKK